MTQQEIRIRLYAAIGDMTIEAAAHDLGEFGTVTAWRRADRLLSAYNEIVGSDADRENREKNGLLGKTVNDIRPHAPTAPASPSLLEIAVRQSASRATMTFNELVAGCTPDERERLAWHLAQIRARTTYEELKEVRGSTI